ncbi:CPBP family intramembrane glutamic endopeptidase [Enterobacteriaceae bacterium C23F]
MIMPTMNYDFLKHETKIALSMLLVFIWYNLWAHVPGVTVSSMGVDFSLGLMLALEFLTAILAYVTLLRKLPGYDLGLNCEFDIIKKIVVVFLTLSILQLIVFYLKGCPKHALNLPSIIVLVFVAPIYEEIFFRGCLFGFACSVYKKNILLPAVVTSIIFVSIHTQYPDIPERLLIFSASMGFTYIRVITKGLVYPILLHIGWNALLVVLSMYVS